MDQTFHKFVADCEQLLQRDGKPAVQFVVGTLHRQALTVDTPGLQVKSGQGLELEIAIRYLVPETGRVTENPVVYRDKDGTIFRSHGEWSYGKKRVERLLAGDNPAEPIKLGKGELGWTTGLD